MTLQDEASAAARPGSDAPGRRLLILAPTGRDADLVCRSLAQGGIACGVCGDFRGLVRELDRGAAGVLLAEEGFGYGQHQRLVDWIAQQPAWSDLPVLVMTRTGADSAAVTEALATLGNVTLLERPMRVSALLSAARAALRARERQYQVRDQLIELERATGALRASEGLLLEADRRKDEFLATLAHELRNPLAPIRNALHLLQGAPVADTDERVLLGMMERQVGHMVRLVDDLLEISRITRGSIELQRAPVPLAALLQSAVETSRPAIEAGAHRLLISLPPGGLHVEGDAVRLAQVLSNLLNNAAKYTDPGGRIAIDAAADGDAVVIRVRDNGIGISAQMLPRVFDMFTQAHGSSSRSHGGLGIGLTLVRSLVEMHGGTVTADSAGPGCGSTFTVRLPAAAAPAPQADQIGADGHGSAGRSHRILVVDDNADAADSLGLLLQSLGADVAVVHGGHAALECLEHYRPDLMFVDIGMPDLDGYEVARRIRAGAGEQPLLVALTGWGQQEDRRRSEEAGFDRHLVKPVALDALQAVLDSLSDMSFPRRRTAVRNK